VDSETDESSDEKKFIARDVVRHVHNQHNALFMVCAKS